MSGGMDKTHDPSPHEEGYTDGYARGVLAERARWREQYEAYMRGELPLAELSPPPPPGVKTVNVGCFIPDGFQPPPWTPFIRGDGFIDIMPSGRPGTVLAKVPEMLGRALVQAANDMFWKHKLETTQKAVEEISKIVEGKKR